MVERHQVGAGVEQARGLRRGDLVLGHDPVDHVVDLDLR
jgi:hypothetical protein